MISSTYTALFNDTDQIDAKASEMLSRGYIALPNFLDSETSKAFHELIADRSECSKKGEMLKGTVAYDLAMSEEILLLSQKLCDARRAITGEPHVTLTKEMQVMGLPYKDGRGEVMNVETAYHYDGAYINFLLPLVLPNTKGPGSGNLVMFPNLRLKYPSLITKLVSRMLRHSALFRRWYGYTEVQYEVGTMYIFFGDVSFHGVDSISSGERVVLTINSHW